MKNFGILIMKIKEAKSLGHIFKAYDYDQAKYDGSSSDQTKCGSSIGADSTFLI